MEKRKDYISWDEYFMAIAILSAKRSKDPKTQVGACIVGKDNRILSLGYNGLPIGMNDNNISWDREGEFKNTKYPYICHAELNAILNYRGSRKDFENSTIYVTLFPCNECAKAIIQSGISKIIYLKDKYADTDIVRVSKKMFDETNVEYIEFDKTIDEIILNFK